jgi:GDP/UDP-N,N'-diacetylbacillosamine 2-epimerase (hydrolysing)
MKRIVYVTGSRAEYGRMRSTLRAIQASPNLKLSLIVVGMHLSKEFGYTINEVEQDRFRIDAKLETIQPSDSGIGMAKAFSVSVSLIASALERKKYDIILILGDRGDMLAAAMVGAHMNIPTAHIGGGYISGSIDDRIRDAITIFSEIHFTANEKTAKRVIDLGANPSNVYVVGAPDLDAILNREFASSSEVIDKFNLDPTKPILLVSQHPVTTEVKNAAEQMRETMEAVTEMGAQAVVTYPNADAGGRRMTRVINEYKRFSQIHVYRNISYFLYLGLMDIADVLVGNSSAGVIEAPSFGLPVINIGNRQEGREKAENVIEVGYDRKEILEAIIKALSPKFKNIARFSKNPYGDGKTGCKIAKILEEIN